MPWHYLRSRYVIVARDHIPRFDERFVNYGWSKISWHYALYQLGFRYQVLPYPFFLIHGMLVAFILLQLGNYNDFDVLEKHDPSQYPINEVDADWSGYQDEPPSSYQFFPQTDSTSLPIAPPFPTITSLTSLRKYQTGGC